MATKKTQIKRAVFVADLHVGSHWALAIPDETQKLFTTFRVNLVHDQKGDFLLLILHYTSSN